MSKPLTVNRFIDAFRLDMGWECEPGTRITNDLTEFATERLGSTRDIVELLIMFKLAHGLRPAVHNADAIEALEAELDDLEAALKNRAAARRDAERHFRGRFDRKHLVDITDLFSKGTS